LDVLDVRKKRLHEMIYSLVTLRVGRPVIRHEGGSDFELLAAPAPAQNAQGRIGSSRTTY